MGVRSASTITALSIDDMLHALFGLTLPLPQREGTIRSLKCCRMIDLARQYEAVNLMADPLLGYIKITKRVHGDSVAAEQDLLDHPWLQRLRRIHQLQSAWWVFPGGEHSRFQHALGAMHLSGEWARRL